jgi:hypothetical protein
MAVCLKDEVLAAVHFEVHRDIELVVDDHQQKLVAAEVAVGRTSILVREAEDVLRIVDQFDAIHIPVVGYNMATDETYDSVDILVIEEEGEHCMGHFVRSDDCRLHYNPRNGFVAADGLVVSMVVPALHYNFDYFEY